MGCVIHYFEIQPFIVTLAGMFLARGLCYVISIESIPITRPAVHARSPRRTVALPGETFVSPSVRHRAGRGRRSALYVLHSHPPRPQRLRDRRQRAVGAADGPAGRPHQDRRLHDQRLLLGARRPAVHLLHRSPGTACTPSAWSSTRSPRSSSAARCSPAAPATSLGTVLGVLVLGLIQTLITFEGTLSSWWTKIVIGVLLLVFILLQRFLVRAPRMISPVEIFTEGTHSGTFSEGSVFIRLFPADNRLSRQQQDWRYRKSGPHEHDDEPDGEGCARRGRRRAAVAGRGRHAGVLERHHDGPRHLDLVGRAEAGRTGLRGRLDAGRQHPLHHPVDRARRCADQGLHDRPDRDR